MRDSFVQNHLRLCMILLAPARHVSHLPAAFITEHAEMLLPLCMLTEPDSRGFRLPSSQRPLVQGDC